LASLLYSEKIFCKYLPKIDGKVFGTDQNLSMM